MATAHTLPASRAGSGSAVVTPTATITSQIPGVGVVAQQSGVVPPPPPAQYAVTVT